MSKKESIQRFLQPKKLAIAGVSANPKKFGYAIFNDLRKKGFDICPVNPKANDIDGVKCYASVSDVPDEYKKLFIVTPKTATNEVLKEASKKGINHVWIQQTANTKESAAIAKENNIDLIEKECIYMFAEPVAGIHKFHRTINKIFGLLPK
jgi:predicted CoA-binding protein